MKIQGCIHSFMLPWKLRKRQILPINKNLSSVYFSYAKFQLVSCNLFLVMIGKWHTHKLPKLCSATLSTSLPYKVSSGIYRCLIWLYSCDTHHVPNVVGQPIDNRIDTADKLQMLGFGGSLSYKEHDKTRRYKRHGYDDKDCNHKICPLTPETCTTITWKSTINFSFVSQFRTTYTSPNCSKAG